MERIARLLFVGVNEHRTFTIIAGAIEQGEEKKKENGKP